MHEYEHAGNFDRLYANEPDLLQEEHFDTQLASIRLLGRDMAMMSDKDTAREVISILDAETQSPYNLLIHMNQGKRMFDGNFETINLQLEKLKQGFIEASAKRV